LLKINFFFYVLDRFDALISKLIFFKKNIILMYFSVKNILKNNHNYIFKKSLHTAKQILLLSPRQQA